MCVIYLGNIFDIVMFPRKVFTVCDNGFREYSCSVAKLLRENVFFILMFFLSKFLMILFVKEKKINMR